MEHSFDVEIAKEYGVNCAVLLKSFYFWIEKNRANKQHEYEGRFWTYNSVKAFEDLFPYMSGRQITSAIKKLEENDLLVEGNFNKSSYDRTKWYALTEKAYSILQKCNIHLTKVQNGLCENVKPIPDTNNKKTNSFSSNLNIDNLNYLLSNNLYNNTEYLNNNTELLNSIKEWMIYKDERKYKYTQIGMSKTLTEIINKDEEYGTEEVVKAIDTSISRGWIGILWDNMTKKEKQKPQKPIHRIVPDLRA